MLNSVIKPQSVSRNIPNEFEHSVCQVIKGKVDIAQWFNEFFTNVGHNLAKKIKGEKELYLHISKVIMIIVCLSIRVINSKFLVLYSCSYKKSNDCDDLSMNIVKQIIGDVIRPLTHVSNQSRTYEDSQNNTFI